MKKREKEGGGGILSGAEIRRIRTARRTWKSGDRGL